MLFGYMVWKKFIVEARIFYWKCYQISIKIHQISNILLFRRNFSQNVDFEGKNLNNEACDFDDEYIFEKLRCNSISMWVSCSRFS